MPSQVILFKAPLPPHNIASDPYYQLLRKQGYEPTFIPVLEESFEAQEIESVLLGRQGAFDAVVITSRRGAEGWLKAAQSVLETGHAHPDWRPIPLHTVGRSALEALSAAPPSLIPLIPSVPGHTAKSAEALLPLLLHETSSNGDGRDHALTKSDALSMESKADKRYLYVRGDKSADILQGALRGAGCEVREVRVYRTQERPGLGEDVKRVLAGVEGIKRTGPEDEGAMLVDSAELGSMRTDAAPHDGREEVRPGQSNTNTTGTVAVDATVKSDDKDADDHSTANNGPAETIWLAFFSPSSAAFVLAHLPRSVLANMVPHDSATYSIDSPVDTPQAVGANGLQRPAGAKFDMVVRTFAIGETTRRYLLTRGIRADAVADTPDAEGLGRAIAIFDASW